MQISQVMTPNPTAAQASDSLQAVAAQMQSGNFGSMPVLDGGRFAGVVTDRDIAVRGVAKGCGPNEPVSAVMSGDPVCVGPDCDVQDAARLMQDKQIRRLYVTDGDALVGVVSLGDVALEAGDQLTGETLEEISKA
ncbi:CBS domain-containing protein [Sphingosinicella sp. LY1275]|uniref:CBS domain-containing protein n=1 Tax=Sphingosinicella sp. LY1275 TaxID=3095379 RepID=UPI002ADEB489|nr:CBS domain-containing protein [Sphingosinicella sp. LY1275]MEA1014752.1 CBS domain-containing protein [Sphingosinicella sp. LY1275]